MAFLAHLEEITAAVQAGEPLRQWYDANKDKLGISYSNFARYVAKFITQPRGSTHDHHEHESEKDSRPAARADAGTSRRSRSPSPAQPKFRFDPHDGDNDDLI